MASTAVLNIHFLGETVHGLSREWEKYGPVFFVADTNRTMSSPGQAQPGFCGVAHVITLFLHLKEAGPHSWFRTRLVFERRHAGSIPFLGFWTLTTKGMNESKGRTSGKWGEGSHSRDLAPSCHDGKLHRPRIREWMGKCFESAKGM